MIYDTDTDRIKELHDSSHDDHTEEYEGNEINVMNENTYGNVDYLGDRDDELNIEAYFRDEKRRDI